jgi:hypothetical protein
VTAASGDRAALAARARDLLAGVTPGEWKCWNGWGPTPSGLMAVNRIGPEAGGGLVAHPEQPRSADLYATAGDAEFVAAAPELVRDLLSALAAPAPEPHGDGLLPCPFCGSTPEAEQLADQGIVHCEYVNCSMNPMAVRTKLREAVAAWNRRALSAAPRPVSEEAVAREFLRPDAKADVLRWRAFAARAVISTGDDGEVWVGLCIADDTSPEELPGATEDERASLNGDTPNGGVLKGAEVIERLWDAARAAFEKGT